MNIKSQFSVARKLLRKKKDETNNERNVIIDNSKSKSVKISDAFRSVDGAIDMASIMIGVLAVGAIGAVIATTVFVVIPWAQDQSAKTQLKSLMNAQQAYAGMKATEGTSGQQIGSLAGLRFMQSTTEPLADNESYAYGDLTDLIEADLFDPSFLPPDADDEVYGEQMLAPDKSMCVIKLAAGEGYEAAILSASGNVFVTNDGWLGPVKVPETSPVCLGRVLGEFEDKEDTVIIPPVVIPIEEMNPAPPIYVEEPAPSETPTDGGEVGGVHESATPTPDANPAPSEEPSESSAPDEEIKESDEPDEIVTPEPSESPVTPSPEPTVEPTVPTTAPPTSSPSPSQSPAPVTPEKAPEPPAANKDPKTKKFMFCHKGVMHSNAFNGMVNGHHGHEEDIMPPIPFKNYVGWNWNAETAKIYNNNCKPL